MLILGIETSCDETACAVVEDGRRVLSNVIASQIDLHRATRGVVPEVAARAHVGQLQPVFDEALSEAGAQMDQIDAIACTYGPGLITALITGTTFASTLAWIYHKQLIPVNHIKAHVLSNRLDRDEDFEFPIVVLTVSGGHNELYLLRSETDFELLGETLDDAAGEAYDKVAKMLELPYPGGPEISRLALDGDPAAIDFPRPLIDSKDFDFSFSGLKTSVLYYLKDNPSFNRADVAASFQAAINDVLCAKLIRASTKYEAKEIHLAGGVSANKDLRRHISEASGDLTFRFPKDISYCTDNAAMIAGAGFYVPKNEWLEAGEVVRAQVF